MALLCFYIKSLALFRSTCLMRLDLRCCPFALAIKPASRLSQRILKIHGMAVINKPLRNIPNIVIIQ